MIYISLSFELSFVVNFGLFPTKKMEQKPVEFCSKRFGRTTCCVPNCSSNSLRTPVVSFHKFPKEPSLKETWLNLLGISKQPLKSHKVCSLHFPGGRKVLGALPTSSLFSNRQTSNSKIGRNLTNSTQQMGIVQQCATLSFLYHRLRALPIWPSRDYIQSTMPKAFRDSYPSTRVIIDCTELFIERPTSFRSQSATYSSYKNHNTAKGLIGISPAGYPSFISELYTGRSSDKQVTKDCGILNLLELGDDLMADKGFDMEDEMPQGVNFNIPPFLKDQQLSVQAENETRKIAAVRVHVERAIQCIKCFRILKNVFPLSMASELNKVWVICSYLTLFQPPIISNDTEHE